ncbi:MAG TPA: cytochrome c [Candidatus Aquilonibacter sp.]|nr:cytochrome c [Candidatus Aquilonibacter sp.]
MRHIIAIILIGAALGAAIVGIAGFRGGLSRKPFVEIFPDMDRQFKLRPMEPFDFFSNGVSSQLPPPGTVARSQPIQTVSGPVYPFEDAPVNTGFITGTTNFVATNPLRVDAALLQRGRERFDIYCSPCHGQLGDGNGITKEIGDMPAVANLHDKRIVEMPDGQIFYTITHGKGLMGAYGPLVPTRDRWAIVAYLRALQLSWLGTTNDLTAEQQAALK